MTIEMNTDVLSSNEHETHLGVLAFSVNIRRALFQFLEGFFSLFGSLFQQIIMSSPSIGSISLQECEICMPLGDLNEL